MLVVFGLLAVAAFSFVVLAPPPAVTTPLKSGVVSEAAEPATTLVDTEAPWNDAQRAQARTDSQEILADILALQKELTTQTVTEWAPDRFETALAMAATGDEYYKAQNFQAAITAYRNSLSELENIRALIPDVIASKLATAQAAVREGKADLARQLYQSVLLLEANNILALTGLDRVATLNEVVEKVQSAKRYETRFKTTDAIVDLQQAEQFYAEALALDARFQRAISGQAAVQALIRDKQFRDAMGDGFTALFANQFSRARAGFSAALKLRPDDPVAKSAYQQALASDTRSSLASMLQAAKQFERREQWSNAVSNYQAVLQRDPNQVAAKLGLIRAGARAELSASIDAALQDPLALSRDAPMQRAQAILADARAVKNPGPQLRAQIARLDKAIQAVDVTIKVALTSDSATRVTLTKTGASSLELGAFARKNLALKPGRYELTGVRLGYQDVRREIELRPTDDDIQTFAIACTKPVGALSTASGD
ncbi:hypothetical protein GCM10008090_22020 [Arenicella chitinivorans]|uniref:Tetratricopeptide repeat protein n=2 Tax=Arenicella chitinivorans TaxID=1329800 RepID=A0A918VNQ0_9GAMM|nr:hypothetical protein GCM10008090_22020 [Arenicella chitinivorans]